jgi:nucleotide-binding universal stress UspA family protein
MTRGRNRETTAGRSLIHRMLFATDFSRCASHAEVYAAFLANAYGASMDVIHVLELYPGMYAAPQDHREKDEQLADAVRRLQRQTTSVTSHVMTGIPSVQICAAAMDYHSDVIVMGTHGRTGLDHILLGSTAERVLTAAPCPVLTVRLEIEGPTLSTSPPIRLRQFVVPVDFSDCALAALEYGVQMARDFGASLTLLHVMEPVPYGHDLTMVHAGEQGGRLGQRIDSQLRAYVSAIQSAGVSVREVIRRRGARRFDS